MDLTFLGRGAAFNYKEDNNSAYFIEGTELFLIDCGESVFRKIMENNLLNGINKINILITHTHSDHVGSLGSLLTFTYFALKQQVNIIVREDKRNASSIELVLKSFGCPNGSYTYVSEKEYDNKYQFFNKIRYIDAIHSEELDCSSILFSTLEGTIYYSGDSKDEEIIKSLIKKDNINKLYIDVTNDIYSANVHLHIDRLNTITPLSIRNKIYCMHFNNDNCIKQALDYGFNIVEPIKSNTNKKI